MDQSNLECCESISSNEKNGDDPENLIRRINSVNTPFPVTQRGEPNRDKSFPIIISSELSEKEKISLLRVLERRKGAIAWKMSDIKGISLSYCTHKILKEDDYKQVIQPQSSWVSLIHVVPKKGRMTVVLNDNDELIPSRTVTGWRVCIDYRNLNDATRKDHFPLPFIDQMLERLCGNEYYYFLDGFSGFFQIPIAPEDQENTTFTYPYGTYAY
ncbi:hypothetical protein Tco_0240921 [Tanacetum coccineum]